MNSDFKKWKRKNVTLRGMKSKGVENGVYASFGKGLYTVPLSNRSMAKEYGKVFFVVNGRPSRPKVLRGLNEAELLRQSLISAFCNKHGERYSQGFFEQNTDMSIEMLKNGFTGLEIKGREIVNYKPKDVQYFETEDELLDYYYSL